MKRVILMACLALFAVGELSAHDTYLKMESHYVQPKTKVLMSLMNGTIDVSENNVALDRLQDVRILGSNGFIQKQNKDQWKLNETLSKLAIETAKPGSYAAGVSIKPRQLEMSAQDFEKYLKHSGVLDVLEQRKNNKRSDKNVVEKYSKHVKAVFQVGDKKTDGFKQRFQYPIEIVPQRNPFALNVGDTLPVKVFFRGKPVSNQLVYASYVGFHAHDDEGQHVEAVQTRTDAQGVAQIKISKKGLWYVKLIHMVASEEKGIDYESNWATMTFEIK